MVFECKEALLNFGLGLMHGCRSFLEWHLCICGMTICLGEPSSLLSCLNGGCKEEFVVPLVGKALSLLCGDANGMLPISIGTFGVIALRYVDELLVVTFALA